MAEVSNKNIKSLEIDQKNIDEYVKRFSPRKYKNREPILDGIPNVKHYLNSKIKICWVLKEPYDENNGQGGGFSLRKMLINDLRKKEHNFGRTWTPIGYLSYSLLNGFVPYNKLMDIDKNTVMKSLLDIAYINIGKMPAKFGTYSPYKAVKPEYEIWAPILMYQLLKYDPDIIIFGNTMDYFWEDLKLDNGKYRKSKNGDYVLKDEKQYLYVYHPAVRESTISEKDYFTGIINSVKKEYSKNNRK
jgi:hypothetical protein